MFVALLMLGCGKDAPSTPLDCSDTWETFGHAYVTTWCTSCHNSALVGPDERYEAPDTVNFDTLDGTRRWALQLAEVATGPDPAMPPSGGVPQNEVDRFANWVACGLPGEGTVVVPDCDDATPVTGDVLVAGPADGESLCANGPITVDGGLDVTADADLSCVCSVGGDLTVTAGVVTLSELQSVGGSLVASDAAVAVAAPELRTVGGSVLAQDVPDLTTFDLAKLETVTGDVLVTAVPDLNELLLPRLKAVPGQLLVQDAGVASLDFTRVVSVSGDFALVDLPSLIEIRGNTGALLTVGGDLRFFDLPVYVQQYGFANLQTVDGDLEFVGLDSTGKLIGFTFLAEIGGTLRLNDNDAMTQYDAFDNLVTIHGGLEVIGNADLLAIDRLEYLETVGGEIRIESNPELLSIGGVANVIEAGGLVIDGMQLTAGFPLFAALSTVHGNLEFRDLVSEPPLGLSTLSLPDALLAVEGSVILEDLEVVHELQFNGGSLATIGGDLVFRRTGIEALDVPTSLQNIDGDLIIQDNGALTDVDALSGMVEVRGDLIVTGNDVLPSAEANALPSQFQVDGKVVIENNGP